MVLELIDFYADWCAPCKIMEPVLEELEKEYSGKVGFKKINVDQNQDESSKFGIMSIPTYVFVKEGKEIDRVIGASSRDNLKSKIDLNLS